MRHAWSLVAIVVVAAPACADEGAVQLFWSTTGLADTALSYSTALTNFLPIVSATPVQELDPGTYDLYLWGKFVEGTYWHSLCHIYGLDLQWEGNATHAQNAAYRHNKTGANPYRRWDGNLGILLDGVMAAVTARGVEYLVPPLDNEDLYFPESQEFLLGAARITGAAGQTKIVSLDTADGLGIAVECVTCGGVPDPTVYPAVLTFTPEPVMAVVLLATALLRPRTQKTCWG